MKELIQRILTVMGILSTVFGCRQNADADAGKRIEIDINNDVQHNQIYEKGYNLISPYILHSDVPRYTNATKVARDEVSLGIYYLNAVTDYDPQNWAAYYFKGKGYQFLRNHVNANLEFRKSFEIQKGNSDVASEFASSCLELGLSTEAILALSHAIHLKPNDASNYANLSLALLIDGQYVEAKKAIEKSLEISPNDEISREVYRSVSDVIAGKRTQPATLSDLQGF